MGRNDCLRGEDRGHLSIREAQGVERSESSGDITRFAKPVLDIALAEGQSHIRESQSHDAACSDAGGGDAEVGRSKGRGFVGPTLRQVWFDPHNPWTHTALSV
jgi:hypothetical protein